MIEAARSVLQRRLKILDLEQTLAGSYWLIPDDALKTFSKVRPGPKAVLKKKAGR